MKNLSEIPEDIQKKLENLLANELSKEIDENIILDVFSPETKGLPKSERWKIIEREKKIDAITGESNAINMNGVSLSNLSKERVDIQNHFKKKTFKLRDINEPGFIFLPYIMESKVVIADGYDLNGKYYNTNINPKYYSNI